MDHGPSIDWLWCFLAWMVRDRDSTTCSLEFLPRRVENGSRQLCSVTFRCFGGLDLANCLRNRNLVINKGETEGAICAEWSSNVFCNRSPLQDNNNCRLRSYTWIYIPNSNVYIHFYLPVLHTFLFLCRETKLWCHMENATRPRTTHGNGACKWELLSSAVLATTDRPICGV